MPRNWRAVVDAMTDVQKLVHLAMRLGVDQEEAIRRDLLASRRKFYEDELTTQAAHVGCPRRKGQLRNGPILSALNDMCQEDAASIVNTYNYDLAAAILQIYAEVPTANRYVYAHRLKSWEAKRAEWKNPQIALYTEMSARSLAQQDFYRYNGAIGMAILKPTKAVCPVCIGWVARGQVPLREAQRHPPPYHVNCPHAWETHPDTVAKSECPNLWMGE